jgi:internalin A
MINLGGYNIEDISQIQGWEKLKNIQDLRLILSGNRLDKIAEFNFLPNLTELFIQNNNLSKIENLDNLDNLESLVALHLDGNDITKLENLYCQNLRELGFSFNKIEKLENLENLYYLETADFCSNKIKSLKNFIPPKNLKYLNISYNPIPKQEIRDFREMYPEIHVKFLSNT